jgi:hypothetical protein
VRHRRVDADSQRGMTPRCRFLQRAQAGGRSLERAFSRRARDHAFRRDRQWTR